MLIKIQVIFEENKIDGKKLILLNCRTLPGLYITDFNDIKVRM